MSTHKFIKNNVSPVISSTSFDCSFTGFKIMLKYVNESAVELFKLYNQRYNHSYDYKFGHVEERVR